MPRKLSINDVKNRIEKYGFFIPDGQVYKNNSTKIRVFDAQEINTVSLAHNAGSTG